MALNHCWQPKPAQLTFQLDPQLANGLQALTRTREEWESLRDLKKVRDQRRVRTLAYGKRFESLRRAR